MIRLLVLLVLLLLIASGFAWLAAQPGLIEITMFGYHAEPSPLVFSAALFTLAFAGWAIIAGGLFLFRIPARVSHAARARRLRKGQAALSRGMIAAGAGDVRLAQRAAQEATKHLGDEPLALLLKAQAAQLAGHSAGAKSTFVRMTEHPRTRVLGLRGLHIEARRRGDVEAAHHFAEQAHRAAPLAWAGHAVLDHQAAHANWTQALATVEANLAQRLIDKPTANRQRAVLQTAIALDVADRDAEQALRLAREAAGLAPDLVPAVALAAKLLGRRGDIRKAGRLIEAAWRTNPHPDLAGTYLDLRPGDSAADRLTRAQALARLLPDDPESRMCVARAALDARDFPLARSTMAALVDTSAGTRPSARVCLIMADIEETENGTTGLAREWLARASRAPRDKAWVADGVTSDTWAPTSPVTGKLDAFRWQTPAERLSSEWVPLPEAEGPKAEAPPTSGETAPMEPLPSPSAPDEATEAIRKLATIREASRQAPRPAGADVFPISTAPDDPGPDRPGH